jgi:uncharacterized protein YgiM (DUF1202 family)
MKQNPRQPLVVALVLALVLMVFGITPIFAQGATLSTPVVVVNTSFLNVRTGPGAQYTVLATVVGGSTFPVLGIGSDGVWYLVSTPVGIGWVNVEFTLPRGDLSVVPEVNVNSIDAVLLSAPEAPTIALASEGQGGGGSAFAAPSTVERFRAAINVEFVNLRQAPAENAPAITILTPIADRLTDFAIVGRSADERRVEWVAINVPNFGVGWVEAPKVITRLSARYATVMVLTAVEFGLTSGPAGGSGEGLPVLLQNQEVFLIGNFGDTYAQVETADGLTGWLPFSVLRFRENTTSDILRQQGDTREAMIAAAMDQGGGGQEIVFPTLDTGRIIVNTSFLNARSGAGGEFSVVATLGGGDELEAVGISRDGFWFLVRGSFGTGWVDTDFVVFRGSIDSVPVVDPSAVLTEATIDTPVAIFSTSLTLYAAPGVNFGAVGFVNGPGELPVVARTADGRWVQVSTPNGFGWVLAEQVIVQGDPRLIPVVG